MENQPKHVYDYNWVEVKVYASETTFGKYADLYEIQQPNLTKALQSGNQAEQEY